MPAGDLATGAAPSATVAIPQGVAPLVVVKASEGRLFNIVITTTGSTSISIYDNASAASGKILFTTPASTPLGTIYYLNMPALNGITVAAQTGTTPAFTMAFS
jgi:hypothetical protein